MRKGLPVLLLILLFTLPSPLFGRAMIVLGADGSFSGFQVRQDSFEAKMQGEAGFSLSESLLFNPLTDRISPFITFEWGLRFRYSSNSTGGYLYNGLSGGYLGIIAGILLKKIDLFDSTFFRPGISLGILGGKYQYTTGQNFLFFPSFQLEPLGEFPLPLEGNDWSLVFRLGLPVTWDLRHDTDLSLGIGLRAGLRVSFHEADHHE